MFDCPSCSVYPAPVLAGVPGLASSHIAQSVLYVPLRGTRYHYYTDHHEQSQICLALELYGTTT
jgi:hypothetical protein